MSECGFELLLESWMKKKKQIDEADELTLYTFEGDYTAGRYLQTV